MSLTEEILSGAADVAGDALLHAAPPDSTVSLELVIKVAERCNIACTYCYFFFSADQSYRDHPAIIPDSTVDDVLAFIKRTLSARKLELLDIVFHGGEPLMAPHKTLERIMSGARAFKQDGLVSNVRFSIQTNGLLLTDRNIAFLNKHAIGTGVSIDGDKRHHDTYRIDHKGRGTYDRAVAGYQRMADSCEERGENRPGVLAVANPEFDGRRIFDHFIDEVRTRNLNFLLPDVLFDDPSVDDAYLEGIERFLIDVFRAWVDRGDPGIRVRFIADIIRPLMNDDAAKMSVKRHLNYTRLITISSDGTLSPEDTMKSIAPRFQNVGHVNDFETIDAVIVGPVFQELEHAIANPAMQCRTCEWLGICAGNKPINRAAGSNGLDNPSVFCKALKSLYLEVSAWLIESGIPMEDVERRLELAQDSPVFKGRLATTDQNFA